MAALISISCDEINQNSSNEKAMQTKTLCIKGASERIARTLHHHSITLASEPSTDIHFISGNVKAKLVEDRSRVIYRIPWNSTER